jgi:hypothetical protein
LLYFKTIPEMFLSSQHYEGMLKEEWRKLKNRSALWAQREYMTIVNRWWYYGCCCFGVQLTSAPLHDTKLAYLFANGLAKLPLAVTIGVCEEGVLILEADHDNGKTKSKAGKDKAVAWTIGSKQVLARFSLEEIDLPRCKDRTHEFQLSLKTAHDGAYVFKTVPGRSYDILQVMHSYQAAANRKLEAEASAAVELAKITEAGGSIGIIDASTDGESKGPRGSKSSTIANAMGGKAVRKSEKKKQRPTAPPPAPPQRTSSSDHRMGCQPGDGPQDGPPPLPVLPEDSSEGGTSSTPPMPPMPPPKPEAMVAAATGSGPLSPPPLPIAPGGASHPPLPTPPGGTSNIAQAFAAAPSAAPPQAAVPHWQERAAHAGEKPPHDKCEHLTTKPSYVSHRHFRLHHPTGRGRQ